jgi:hypothetical protein
MMCAEQTLGEMSTERWRTAACTAVWLFVASHDGPTPRGLSSGLAHPSDRKMRSRNPRTQGSGAGARSAKWS